jgi:mRNA-degrading endonuclease RelE of RelBE toxin-antitoxin system
MSPQRWSVVLTPEAVADKYKVPRGEAAHLSAALAELYNGPQPPGYRLYSDDNTMPTVFEFTRHGYRIVYEVIADRRTIRVLFFVLMN